MGKKTKRKGVMGRKVKKIDPVKDFDTGTRKEPAQGNLVEIPPEPARSPVVQHGKMSAHFVRFVTDRSKDRNPIVFLDFSLELEDVHEGRLPREIEDEWKHFKRGSVKRTDPSGMGPQNLELSSVADSEPDLAVVAAMSRAVISRITQKGKGKERKVIRLQMRFLTAYTADVDRFCRNNYDETTWLSMKESQMSLGEADGEAAEG
jgi:hypothetical protein